MEWPASLPQSLQLQGYSDGLPDNTLRSPMDIGPEKVRRRTTSTPRPLNGRLILTGDQLEILADFYTDDLIGGSLRFDWIDPYTGGDVEMRFSAPPSWSRSGEYYSVNLSLQILP